MKYLIYAIVFLFGAGADVAAYLGHSVSFQKRIFIDNAIGKILRRKPEGLLQKTPLEA
jgi:hypothetical protein